MKYLIMLENVANRKSIKMQQYSSYRELADILRKTNNSQNEP